MSGARFRLSCTSHLHLESSSQGMCKVKNARKAHKIKKQHEIQVNQKPESDCLLQNKQKMRLHNIELVGMTVCTLAICFSIVWQYWDGLEYSTPSSPSPHRNKYKYMCYTLPLWSSAFFVQYWIHFSLYPSLPLELFVFFLFCVNLVFLYSYFFFLL